MHETIIDVDIDIFNWWNYKYYMDNDQAFIDVIDCINDGKWFKCDKYIRKKLGEISFLLEKDVFEIINNLSKMNNEIFNFNKYEQYSNELNILCANMQKLEYEINNNYNIFSKQINFKILNNYINKAKNIINNEEKILNDLNEIYQNCEDIVFNIHKITNIKNNLHNNQDMIKKQINKFYKMHDNLMLANFIPNKNEQIYKYYYIEKNILIDLIDKEIKSDHIKNIKKYKLLLMNYINLLNDNKNKLINIIEIIKNKNDKNIEEIKSLGNKLNIYNNNVKYKGFISNCFGCFLQYFKK